MPALTRAFLVLLAAISALLLLAPAPPEVPAAVMRAAGVMVVAIGLWSSGAIPEYLTAILFFFLAVVLAVAPPAEVFAGFHSTAVWLVFGGLVIGFSVQQSGLGNRAVDLVLLHLPRGYLRLTGAVALIGLLLAFLVPSAMGRVMLLTPIVVALAERLGYAPGSKGRTGLVFAAGLGTTLPAFGILPSNVPNMALIGAAESIYGTSFRYGDYFLLNFPALGLCGLVATTLLITLFFGEAPSRAAAAREPRSWSRDERVLLAVLLVTVAIWASDALHGLSPAWVALGAAIVCLWPRYGIVAPAALSRINFGPWFFVAGVIGLGAVANDSGFASFVGQQLLQYFDLAGLGGWQQYVAIVAIGMTVALLTCHPAAPAIMTPLAASLASNTGWPLESVLLAQVPTWAVFPFPYQVPPLLVALSLGGIAVTRIVPMMLAYFLFGLLITLPLHYIWGAWLGVFP